jgi:hypothetical protein
MLYMVTFTINIPQMLAYIPYMDPMGHSIRIYRNSYPTGESTTSCWDINHIPLGEIWGFPKITMCLWRKGGRSTFWTSHD